ncbi:MAG: hypothetical protein HC842_01630 [Cytophagales bacterium]|nr:hypothetical protein [Cytophagales bacterium]
MKKHAIYILLVGLSACSGHDESNCPCGKNIILTFRYNFSSDDTCAFPLSELVDPAHGSSWFRVYHNFDGDTYSLGDSLVPYINVFFRSDSSEGHYLFSILDPTELNVFGSDTLDIRKAVFVIENTNIGYRDTLRNITYNLRIGSERNCQEGRGKCRIIDKSSYRLEWSGRTYRLDDMPIDVSNCD